VIKEEAAKLQKDYDNLQAAYSSIADPEQIPDGEIYPSVVELLEYLNAGETDMNKTVQLTDAIVVSIFGHCGLSQPQCKKRPIVDAANGILTQIGNSKVPKEAKDRRVSERDLQEPARKKSRT
jgi:hypothetical protein